MGFFLSTSHTVINTITYAVVYSMNISFAGCGFQGMYHLGAVSCLQRHGKGLLKGAKCFGGASAGSLVAAVLATSTPLEKGVQFTVDLAVEVRKHFLGALSPSFDLMQYLEGGLNNILPENSHEQASGKLHVSLSSYPHCENVIVSQFASKNELIQVQYSVILRYNYSITCAQAIL